MNKKTTKKPTVRKRRTKKNLPKSPIFYINIIIVLCSIILVLILTLFLEDDKVEVKQPKSISMIDEKIAQTKNQELQAKYFEEKTQAMEIEYATQNDTTIKPKEDKKPKEIFHFDDEKTIDKKPIEEKTPELTKPKPKPIIATTPTPVEKKLPRLAIIIDDVTTTYQVKKIQSIDYPVTMAFLPPTKQHPISAKLAQDIKVYMIHLPLQANSNHFEEENTLYTTDTLETIDKRIQTLKKLYPKAEYINNHTGSKFTADANSMDKLLKVLKKHNYNFVDSRTTGKTVSRKYAKKHKVKHLARNIFLDNKKDKQYIQKQLSKAVRIAKRDGMAIAIGHPHSITLKTLANSKHLLNGLDIVFINKL